jgi:hypothetical protein
MRGLLGAQGMTWEQWNAEIVGMWGIGART